MPTLNKVIYKQNEYHEQQPIAGFEPNRTQNIQRSVSGQWGSVVQTDYSVAPEPASLVWSHNDPCLAKVNTCYSMLKSVVKEWHIWLEHKQCCDNRCVPPVNAETWLSGMWPERQHSQNAHICFCPLWICRWCASSPSNMIPHRTLTSEVTVIKNKNILQWFETFLYTRRNGNCIYLQP